MTIKIVILLAALIFPVPTNTWAQTKESGQRLTRPQIDTLFEKERQTVLKIKIPKKQQVESLKFVRKIIRIFDAMGISLIKGILRKDIDRYDDTIVDATGEVPENLLDYVADTYQALDLYHRSSKSNIFNNGIKSGAKKMALPVLERKLKRTQIE